MHHRCFAAAGGGLDVAQHLLPLAHLSLLLEADAAHHRRSDRWSAAEPHFQVGTLLLGGEEAIKQSRHPWRLGAQHRLGEHLIEADGTGGCAQWTPLAVIPQFGAGKSVALTSHGPAQGAVAIDRCLGTEQQGTLLIRLHQKHPQSGWIAVLIGEQSAGMQMHQRLDAFGAGAADADGKNLFHLSDCPEG